MDNKRYIVSFDLYKDRMSQNKYDEFENSIPNGIIYSLAKKMGLYRNGFLGIDNFEKFKKTLNIHEEWKHDEWDTVSISSTNKQFITELIKFLRRRRAYVENIKSKISND